MTLRARDYTVRFLADTLVDAGMLAARQRDDVVRNADTLKQKILRRRMNQVQARRMEHYTVSPVEVLADAGFQAPDGTALTEDRLMQFLADYVGLAHTKLDPLKLNERFITETMSRPFARRHVCLPLARDEDGAVRFAVDNPFDLELQESLRTLSPSGFRIVLSAKSDILRIITDLYGFRKAVSAAEQQISGGVDLGNLEQLVKLTSREDIEATDKYVINAVEYLLHYAFEQRASDIHLEPKRGEAHVRLRIDGVLHTIFRLPIVVHKAVVSRLKTLARMDIAERRRPQDGRIKTAAQGRETELRVSSVPVAFGEKIVLRIFDPQTLLQNLEGLGFFESELSTWRDFSSRTHGLVLITGPTGSGKTTTLYSTLQRLASPDVNITTIEDPIEMVHEQFNQILVQKKIGLSFADALRNVLRQDPDIIMLGEVRDAETAQMATQAALTGHLVFATLHTNDAPSAITRLQDLGVPPFLIASTVTGVMAQRLVRKICEHCKTPTTLVPEQASLLGIALPDDGSRTLPVWYGEGCAHCRGTGFFGRTGVFEVMPVDSGVRALLKQGADADALRREAIANGMTPLREAGIRKLALGMTSFDEMVRILSDH
jgi:general secretion pathway protein E